MVSGTLLILLPLFTLPAQFSTTQLSQAQTFTVRGTVVNATTGAPIGGALVQLFAGQGPTARRSGADGGFAFEGVPAGTYTVRAQKPGFFFPPELPMQNAPQPTITAGPDHTPALIKLIPEGIISGHITGDDGEPLEFLPVQLLSERTQDGKKWRSFERHEVTDEQGEFRLAELQPGRYIVALGPSSFQSTPPPIATQTGVRGYPAIFYPGVPEMSSATAIEITPGKHAEVNLKLSSQPFYRVSGTVRAPMQNQGISLQITNAAGQSISSGFQFDPVKGTFRTQGLPAGPCTLTAQMHDAATQQQYFASQTVNLTSDLAGVHLLLLPNSSIPVTFVMETTRNERPPEQSFFVMSGPNGGRHRQASIPANIVLTPQNQLFMSRQYYSQLGPGEAESLSVRDIPPGVYTVEVRPNGPYYAASVRSGTVNLLVQPLTITSGGAVQPIEVVLSDDFATLEGSISFEGSDIAAELIVVPEDAPLEVRPFNLGRLTTLPGQARPTTRFEFAQLRPGNYKLLAVDDLSFEYANPAVLEKYASKAQEVFLAPGQQTKVSVDLVHIGD